MADGAIPDLIAPSRPRSAHAHLAGDLLLLADQAAVFGLSPEDALRMSRALTKGDGATQAELARLGLDGVPAPMPDTTLQPVRALALTVSQSCNMACGYCYAAGGSFGGPDTRMTPEVAQRAIDQLIDSTPPGGAVKIAFMGGEPMLARDLIMGSVRHTRERAAARAISIGFSMTTNGTLLRPEDAAFLAEQRFAVTVSLDGDRETNDRLRPMNGGQGSFDRIAKRLAPLFDLKDRLSLSARVTATPNNLDIPRTVAALSELGFSSVGVSPMLTSPTGKGALRADDLPLLLQAMIDASENWLADTLAGRPNAFANLATALQEIHRGKARDHSCGAVRDYLAVDAQGAYSACHRFVNDPLGEMGDLDSGIDHKARDTFLRQRTVTAQESCQTCWARKLCGGGCHHEVLHAGRPACDFVRGWLHFALGAYARMMAEKPDWFDA
ncbi:MAG: SPASM domain-containing protein [Thalassococcus sp.]|uniref:radical SAM/SPASM domain-containing protein n=1 Tax=Thalassococcus sp. TaxID=1928858 RepID=UPI001B121974|nr:radical SAM protein [Thalassococcus sp.]MBO6867565.1 SPASM domain-containing protein [Thalassococcus sp.]